RGAIRNPWLFGQIRDHLAGNPVTLPTGRDVLAYLHDLFESTKLENYEERGHVTHMKKYLNYVGVGIDPEAGFLHAMRRATTAAEYFRICTEFLDHDEPMPLEPFDLKLGERDIVAGVMR
ncbi:MAG TPA: dihydrouridine synthase, partial [Verrucomicrobiales bacterium]|nr:dihydrouridine synthase [Verrucomicrobiales bacterium]